MSEYLLIENAVAGQSIAVFPSTLPFEVAALNEPMAVARRCVNRSGARAADKVVVFGAGPIGLGTVIWLKLRGVRQVTVADVIPRRLLTALAVGADAVIDSSREDVTARLTGLHGHSTNALGAPRPDTDIYIDAAGAAAVVNTAPRAAKWGARLVTAAVHKKPEPIDLGAMLRSENHHHRVPGLPHRDLRGHPADRAAPAALLPADQPPRPLLRRRPGLPARAHPRRRRKGHRDLRRLTPSRPPSQRDPSIASTDIRRGRRAAGATRSGTDRKDQMMNHYRTAVLAAAACAAGMSLAACTVTTTTPASSPAPAGSTASVSGPIGRFPLPPGAQLINDGTDNGHYDIVFGSVSPSEVSRFYTTALPRAGYTIISNSSATGDSFSGTGIWFTGHGYNGQIGALSSFQISGISLGGNTVEITLTPQ